MTSIPPEPASDYATILTEIEQVEIASILSFHWGMHPECNGDLEDQYRITCAVVERMIRRRISDGLS